MISGKVYHFGMCLFWVIALFLIDTVDATYFAVFALGANVAMFANEFKPKAACHD